jgi:hypothetical protein
MDDPRWLTEAQLGLRYGLPPQDVKALVRQGRAARSLPRRGGKTPRFPTKYDGDAFGKLPGLQERQRTDAARQFACEHRLMHVYPTFWDRLLEDSW